jgi:hypothetical protein
MAEQHHDEKAAQGSRRMNEPKVRSLQFRLHHVVIAAIALMVALAMALNYYIW